MTSKRILRKGFTLIELLVVVVIIAILASGVFLMMRAGGDRSGIAKTTAKVHAIASMLESYKAAYGRYPRVRTGVSEDGVSSVAFSFVCDPGGDDTVMADDNTDDGGLSDSNKITFGLFSHFMPRAKLIDVNARDSMRSYYEGCIRNPKEGSVWEVEYRGGTSGNLSMLASEENANPNLNEVYREFRRLAADGLVSAGPVIYPDTGKEVYLATASDAWGRTLYYRQDGGVGEIISAGPDGVVGTADDISSAGAGGNDDDE